MDWIPVNDRLPGVSQMVLCYMPVSHAGYRGVHYGWLGADGSWRTHTPFHYNASMEDSKQTGCEGSKVTHWAALPEPPTDAKDEVEGKA